MVLWVKRRCVGSVCVCGWHDCAACVCCSGWRLNRRGGVPAAINTPSPSPAQPPAPVPRPQRRPETPVPAAPRTQRTKCQPQKPRAKTPAERSPSKQTPCDTTQRQCAGRHAPAVRSARSAPSTPAELPSCLSAKLPQAGRRADATQDSLSPVPRANMQNLHPSPVPHRRRVGCVGGAAGWVCAGWGWVCRVCRGRVPGVSGVCWLGVSGECRRRVAGVSRACGGCVRGVSAACARGWMEAVCPGARDSPPRRGSAASSFFPRDERVARLPLPADCPRGLPLFFRVCTSPGTRAAVPLGLLLPLFPGDSKTRKIKDTQDSCFSPCAPHVALFAVAVLAVPTAPHHTQLQFSPPRKKHPPDPRGPSTRPGMDAGRPPRCVRARQASCRASAFGFSTAFQTARRQGGASKRRARRCL